MRKLADLLPEVKLQQHQQHLADEAAKDPVRKLMLWSLGSGKSLGAIAAAEAHGEPYTAIVPAALRPNMNREIERFTDQKTPSSVLSYSELALGKKAPYPKSIITDESHRLRNPESEQSKQVADLARKADQVLMLSGTPLINEPADLAVPMSILTRKEITPREFDDRYVKHKNVYPNLFRRLIGSPSGTEPEIAHREELKALLKGHIDYYDTGKPVVPVNQTEIPVTMGTEQTRLYKAMWDQLPIWLRWKLKHDYPLSREELVRMQSFLTGPRQVGLSTYPYLRNKDPLKAFEQSTKLQEAHKRMLQHLKDPRKKALVFANFIDAGLVPYSAALTRSGVPNAVFHGGLSDKERKNLVNDYNEGRLRVALIGPSGTEGLSFRGTQVQQLLDPHFQGVRGQQAIGRGLRFDSHTDLPEDLQNMAVERYMAKLPLGFKDQLLSAVGFNRDRQAEGTDDHLKRMEERKRLMNQKFLDLLKEVGTENQN